MKGLVLIIFVVCSGAVLAQKDSIATEKLSVGLSAGLLLPDANGFTTTANVMYEAKLRYTFAVDVVRYDYINLKQIDYSGFQGSLNNINFLLGKSWNIKKLKLGVDAGVFVGNGRFKFEDETKVTPNFYENYNYEVETAYYEPNFTLGVKTNVFINILLGNRWRLGGSLVYWRYQQARFNYSAGINLLYLIKQYE